MGRGGWQNLGSIKREGGNLNAGQNSDDRHGVQCGSQKQAIAGEDDPNAWNCCVTAPWAHSTYLNIPSRLLGLTATG